MKKDKEKVIKCGWQEGYGEGTSRDQSYEKNNNNSIKRDMGGPIKKLPANVPQSGPQGNPSVKNQKPQLAPTPTRENAGVPINVTYTLKKGGSTKDVLKKGEKSKKVKSTSLKPASAAIIEAISIIPKATKESKEIRIPKAMGGAAKIRQGTFGLQAKPLIKK